MALIKCKECKKQVSDKSDACVHCGYKIGVSQCPECSVNIPANNFQCKNCGYSLSESNDNPQKEKNDDFAVVGMILGLCSILAWIIPLFGYPCTIVGIVFSASGLNSKKKEMAITGLVLNIIFLIVTLINSILGAAIVAGIF